MVLLKHSSSPNGLILVRSSFDKLSAKELELELINPAFMIGTSIGLRSIESLRSVDHIIY
jgi:hypothetical protein